MVFIPVLMLMLAGVVHEVTCGLFDGFRLLTVTAKSQEQVDFLHQLEERYYQLDFWSLPAVNRSAILMLTPGLVFQIPYELALHDIDYKKLDLDIGKIIRGGITKPPVYFGYAESGYHPYGQIVRYLTKIRRTADKIFYKKNGTYHYGAYMKVFSLPHPTYQGREVTAVKLSGSGGGNRPAILIESGMNAREWIATASMVYIIPKLVHGYISSHTINRYPESVFMLDNFDWYIIPVANPDGYQYSLRKEENRLWTKNRKKLGSSKTCNGVDPNRNFDTNFGKTGASRDCRSINYPGKEPFSEPESRNIRDLYNTLSSRLVAYVSLHASSQVLVLPRSWSDNGGGPAEHKDLESVARQMADAIKRRNGRYYDVGTPHQLFNYAPSGSAQDWVYEASNRSLYALTYELRPRRDDPVAFNIPAIHIRPSGMELYASLSELAKQLKSRLNL